MRRVLAIGIIGLVLLSAWLVFRPEELWVVSVHADKDPSLEGDEYCVNSVGMVGGSETLDGIGGQFSGLYTVESRADGEVLAGCFEDQGANVEVRQMTDADREQFDG